MNVWMGGGQKLASRANVLLLLQANAFVEEIGFSLKLKADCFHPFEWVAHFLVSTATKGNQNQESVSAELDEVAHHDRN
jgi:hypothetical protein